MAFFVEGYQVQDAPRYGAERRGAPIFAYVRAARDVINERGVITQPDLVLVTDDSLMSIPAAGVCQGLIDRTVLCLVSRDTVATWTHRLNLSGLTVVLPPMKETEDTLDLPYVGSALAGAAARLLGVISRDSLIRAIEDELKSMATEVCNENLATALRAYDSLEKQAGIVTEGQQLSAESFQRPEWVESLFEEARVSAPAIHAGLTSIEVRTGLWRTMRPVIDHDRCNRCWWVCSTFCPDNAISVNDEGYPEVDYDHCKGCMICVAKCPPHAIAAIPEHEAKEQEASTEAGP